MTRGSNKSTTKSSSRVVKPSKELLSIPQEILKISCCDIGENGELGLGLNGGNAVKRPRLNPLMDKENVVSVAVGGAHVMYLTIDGRVFTHGVGDDGALGRHVPTDQEGADAREIAENPAAVQFPHGVKIARIAAGDSFSIAISTKRRVYAWGTFRLVCDSSRFKRLLTVRQDDGSKGFSATTQIQKEPSLIRTITNVVDVAAGANYVTFMTADGKVCIVGTVLGSPPPQRRRLARLGSEPRDYVGSPTWFKGLSPRAIFAGERHGFILSSSSKGHVLAFGSNSSGQCGMRGGSQYSEPNLVTSLSEHKIVSIAAGSEHTIMLTNDNNVLACGVNLYGELGLGARFDEIDASDKMLSPTQLHKGKPPEFFALAKPSPIVKLSGHAISVACGARHSIVTTKTGQIYTFGLGSSYQTGLVPIKQFAEVRDGMTHYRDLDWHCNPMLVRNTVTTGMFMTVAAGGATFSVFGGRTMSEEEIKGIEQTRSEEEKSICGAD